jgi:hypothetical protein
MSYYFRLICRSSLPPPAQLLLDFVYDGWYFDVKPQIELRQENQESWDRLVIHYADNKRPVMLINTGPGPLLEVEIRQMRVALSNVMIDDAIKRTLSHLDEASRIIAIEIDPIGLTDNAWTMIDCLQSFIARDYRGLIYAPDDGYYDASLQPILKFSQLRQAAAPPDRRSPIPPLAT